MGKNNNSNGYLFLTLILSEIKDSGKQGSTTASYILDELVNKQSSLLKGMFSFLRKK